MRKFTCWLHEKRNGKREGWPSVSAISKVTAAALILSLNIWGCIYPGGLRTCAVEEWGRGMRYVDPVFPDIVVHEDVQYGEAMGYRGQREKLLLDLYLPEGDAEGNRPAVMLIHGGGFGHGDKQQDLYVAMAGKFARRGYVALSIDYRLVNPKNQDKAEAVLDTAVADALTALEWLKGHAEKYGINPEKMPDTLVPSSKRMSYYMTLNL